MSTNVTCNAPGSSVKHIANKFSDPAASLTITYTFINPRRLPPVLFHFTVLRVAAVIGLLHLTTLQRAPRSNRLHQFALFILLPTVPLASIICRLAYCIRSASIRPSPNDMSGYLAYLLSAVLGLRTWANGASLEPLVERGARASEVPAGVNDNSNSSSLLSSDFSDFQLLRCTCTTRVCERFKRPPFIRTAALLIAILLYCSATFLLYLRRCSYTYEYMAAEALLGTPPGSREVKIYSNALEMVAGFDQSNAMWAIGGVAVSLSALVLKFAGWEFTSRDNSDSNEKSSATEPPFLLYAEYALAFILYILFTRQSWARAYLTWNSAHPYWSLFFLLSKLANGFFAAYLTYCWVHGIENWKKETTGASVLLAWIMFVSLFPTVFAERDAWSLVSCVSGGACRYPLLLWKDSWSDYLWVY